jgi:hypothetical protein
MDKEISRLIELELRRLADGVDRFEYGINSDSIENNLPQVMEEAFPYLGESVRENRVLLGWMKTFRALSANKEFPDEDQRTAFLCDLKKL